MADDAMAGLKDDGRNGVQFDPAAATTMAQQCASMLSIVDAAIRAVSPTTSLKPLSQKAPDDSGHQLADKFNAAAKNLVETVLKDHQTVLTNMGEAFVAAGKLYIGTDEASRDAIQSGKFSDQQLSGAFQDFRGGGGQPGLAEPNIPVDSLSMPGWKQSSYDQEWNPFSDSTDGYSYSGTAKQDYDNQLASTSEMKHLMDDLVKQNGVTIDPYPIAPETSAVYGWNDFHNHWKYIKENDVPGQLESYAQAWHKAQTYLKVQAQTFESAANKYLQPFQGNTADIDKVWASPAAKQAKDAINKYLANMKTLVMAMEVMATNLADTQGWVKKLQTFLPYKSFEEEYPPGQWVYQSNVDAFVKDMKRAWDAWYVVGVQDSSGAIPIMPSPKSSMEIKPPEVKVPADQPNPTTQQPGYTPSTQTPNTETPSPVDDKQPTNTDPKNTDPKNATPTTTTTDTTLQTLITQASTVLQAGITAAEQGAEKLASAVQTALTQTQTNTKTTDPTDQLTQQLQNLALIPNANNPSGAPTGGSPSGGTPTSPGSPQTPKTQLSPRSANPSSTVTEAEEATTSRAGVASTSSSSSTGSTGGMGGSPMAAGSQGQGQGKEHKRPQFLTNLENLEEVLGEAPAAVTPVAEK